MIWATKEPTPKYKRTNHDSTEGLFCPYCNTQFNMNYKSLKPTKIRYAYSKTCRNCKSEFYVKRDYIVHKTMIFTKREFFSYVNVISRTMKWKIN